MRNLNLDQQRSLIEISDLGSFTEAAKRLHFTAGDQPADPGAGEPLRDATCRSCRQARDRHKRSLVETTMSRYKALIGPRLRARGFAAQQTEAAIGVAVLYHMLAAGRPDSATHARHRIAGRGGVIACSVLHMRQRPRPPTLRQSPISRPTARTAMISLAYEYLMRHFAYGEWEEQTPVLDSRGGQSRDRRCSRHPKRTNDE
jgi:hypothetical protein